jgi:UDP-N-acetylglucosamine--N-acetylmuramyl-(pentapeptide) pyrophosphoryl-undecaprenol N-acetylglucosamine transferase
VEPFFDDMPAKFGAASLVLCRSGASTVAELAAAQKPSLLIPFPLAADDHQRCNAEVLVQAEAAVMLIEAQLTPQRLLTELIQLLQDPQRLAAMGQKARNLAHADAAASIASLLKQQQPA